VVARRGITEAGALSEANRLLIEYMGYQDEIAFLAVQHKWGRIMALVLNEHSSLTRLSDENAFTFFKVVESIREQLSRNYNVLDNNAWLSP
jgi:hypothetical protein